MPEFTRTFDAFRVLVIIIISLFQEDNIFGTNASLTYGPQFQRQKWHWQLNMHKLFTVCTEQVRSPYSEHAASGLPNHNHLEGKVRFDKAQDQQVVTTRSPRIVTECLLTRSMLIKMYMIYSWFRRKLFCLSESMNMSLSLHYNYRVWWVLSVLADVDA